VWSNHLRVESPGSHDPDKLDRIVCDGQRNGPNPWDSLPRAYSYLLSLDNREQIGIARGASLMSWEHTDTLFLSAKCKSIVPSC